MKIHAGLNIQLIFEKKPLFQVLPGSRSFSIATVGCNFSCTFCQNHDISQIQEQLERYYEAIKANAANIAEEGETIFRQKLELGLYKGSDDRLEAMKTLTFNRDISQFQFILVLVDYNPNSALLSLYNLEMLPFANQIKVFHGGFAMWQQNVKSL